MDNISVEELALQRKRYAHLTDEQWRFMLQQVDGRQRTRDKLPTFAAIADWWYPVRLSCEQCSSEVTAKYKSQLIANQQFDTLVDLTAGYGVDTFFMSYSTREAHYIERNQDLCQIAAHNFHLTHRNIQIHNTTAEDFVADFHPVTTNNIIYLDPARRNKNGNKVFLLEDCEPNIISLLPTLLSKARTVLIKLSPMLDITAAVRALNMPCEVHIVAVQNEVKEVLIFLQNSAYLASGNGVVTEVVEEEIRIHAVNLLPQPNHMDYCTQEFSFSIEDERRAECQLYSALQLSITEENIYIYEPNAAIIKAGAFKLVAQRFQFVKMATNTHLYLSHQLVEDFPGRVWKVVSINPRETKNIAANIMTRNYPLSPDELRKKLKIKDSNTSTIIGARLADKPTLFLCDKL
jgi:16S rRNA G966 N2-methylase RsmD